MKVEVHTDGEKVKVTKTIQCELNRMCDNTEMIVHLNEVLLQVQDKLCGGNSVEVAKDEQSCQYGLIGAIEQKNTQMNNLLSESLMLASNINSVI